MNAFVDIENFDFALLSEIPIPFIMKHSILPIAKSDDQITILIPDDIDPNLFAWLSIVSNGNYICRYAPRADIEQLLAKLDPTSQMLSHVSQDFMPTIVKEDEQGNEREISLDSIQGQSGVTKLINSIIMSAIDKQISDIHFENSESGLEVRFRSDGVLSNASEKIDNRYKDELTARIKVMSELDITEKRRPQDGRFRLRIRQNDIDFRVSIIPTDRGENIVLRILDRNTVARFGSSLSLDALELNPELLRAIKHSVARPHGLFLVTGPTGSGKTTTLYAALSELTNGIEKIITIEDPVEYHLEGVTQIAVNEKKGVSFASGLRAVLRHDPDKIMVGEIRDLETAEIAVQAALTGHLVLATLHANSAVEVINRMYHWGIDEHNFISALNAVLSQRLVRKLCEECKVKYTPDSEEIKEFGLKKPKLFTSNGCRKCNETGYRSRIVAAEFLNVTPTIKSKLYAREPADMVFQHAVTEGMTPLRDSALEQAIHGHTSLDEVRRLVNG